MNERNKCTLDKLVDYFQDHPKMALELIRGMLKALYMFAVTLGLSFGAVLAYQLYTKIFP